MFSSAANQAARSQVLDLKFPEAQQGYTPFSVLEWTAYQNSSSNQVFFLYRRLPSKDYHLSSI